MADVWFYHLEGRSAESVLPVMMQRGLERNLRMAIETSDAARAAEISQALWAAEDVAFIPHGWGETPNPADNPVWITTTSENPNGADYRFFVDGRFPESVDKLVRATILFDAGDANAVQTARDLWKKFKAEGHAIKYWRMDDGGRWQDQAGQ